METGTRYRYRLAPRPGPRPDAGRVEAWLKGRGYALPDGVTVEADGAVLLNADRDPSTDWPAYAEGPTPEPAEAAALLARMEAGTATTADLRRAAAILLRRTGG